MVWDKFPTRRGCMAVRIMKYFWDEVAKAAYLYNGETFISYEDKKALSYKAAYVREQGMKGMMFWEYSEDQTRTLVEHLYTELHKEE